MITKYFPDFPSEKHPTIIKVELSEYHGNTRLYKVERVERVYGGMYFSTPNVIGKSEPLFDTYKEAIDYLYDLLENFIKNHQNKINETILSKTNLLRSLDAS